jgi:superfamily II DNA or RNA helicase
VSYADFLTQKRRVVGSRGIEATAITLPAPLYDWQVAIVRWALRKGRAAIFADCGLGKTFMQVAWAQALDVPTLILAPLCVAEQTVDEALKLGVVVRYVRDQQEANRRQDRGGVAPIFITNYERLEQFDTSAFQAVVLDESSILKAFDGQTRNALIAAFAHTPYRLCCTATPSPNDITELANHAEFLGLMTRPEFLATWFIRIGEGHRTTTHHGWRMKKHAIDPFFRWLASWAVAIRSPRDLGFDDAGFQLPALVIRPAILSTAATGGDSLFPELGTKGIQGRMAARRTALPDRIDTVAELAAQPGQWLLWCGLNEESRALARAIPDAVDVAGDDPYATKVSAVQRFTAGEIRVLISKPRILGFGMNFQHCHQMVFVGLSDSYETYYQCIRRCWRYGQTTPVAVTIVVSEAEAQIVENVRRKEAAAADLSASLLQHLAVFERNEVGAV